MTDIFISYSSLDKETASVIAEKLKGFGYNVFLDFNVLVPGENFSNKITDEIKKAKVVLVLLSKNSNRSSWVQHELTSALEQGQSERGIPVLLDSDAKNNWVWPLVADREPLEIANIENDLERITKRVLHILPAPILKNNRTSSYLYRALVVGFITITVGYFFIYNSPKNNIEINIPKKSHALAEEHEKLLYLKVKKLGKEHPEVATSLNNLASIYSSMGDYDKSADLYKKSLAIREKTLGGVHPDSAQSMKNLGNLYELMGRLNEAELLYVQALAIQKKIFGKKHANTVLTMINLGNLYMAQGEVDRAEELFENILSIQEKILESNSPQITNMLNSLIRIYELQGNLEKSSKFREKLEKSSQGSD